MLSHAKVWRSCWALTARHESLDSHKEVACWAFPGFFAACLARCSSALMIAIIRELAGCVCRAAWYGMRAD